MKQAWDQLAEVSDADGLNVVIADFDCSASAEEAERCGSCRAR